MEICYFYAVCNFSTVCSTTTTKQGRTFDENKFANVKANESYLGNIDLAYSAWAYLRLS